MDNKSETSSKTRDFYCPDCENFFSELGANGVVIHYCILDDTYIHSSENNKYPDWCPLQKEVSACVGSNPTDSKLDL